jgi:hypothetical protein
MLWRLVYVMQAMESIMPKHAMSAMQLLAGLCVSAALAACAFDPPPARARTDDSCYIGGCAAEVCSDRPDVVSPCIWRDAYVCFRDATCARQPSGACGWTQTPELSACLASHDPLSGPQPGSQH